MTSSHFTANLVQRLTGRSSPGWLNRAASIGVALPCVVPRDWIEPPEHDNGHGLELGEDEHSESSGMLADQRSAQIHLVGVEQDEMEWEGRERGRVEEGRSGKGKQGPSRVRDDAGRALPAAEIALPSRHA